MGPPRERLRKWILTCQTQTIAKCRINKGEEIYSTYVKAAMEFPLRQATLQSCWGFECRCDLCRLDAADEHETRQALCTAQHRHNVREGKVNGLLELKRRLEDTYTPGRTERPALALVLKDLSDQEGLDTEQRFKVCSFRISDTFQEFMRELTS